MKIEDKLAKLAIKHDERSHIEVRDDECVRCETKICVRTCPAQLYEVDAASGRARVEHAGCLECGTCLVICPLGAVRWSLPEPGFGITYRYG